MSTFIGGEKEMKNYTWLLLGSLLVMASCDRVKNHTKSAINTTGEVVGKGASEFVNGVSEGIDQTFQSTISLSDELAAEELGIGKFKITHPSDSSNYILTAYLIFNKDLNVPVVVKVYDKDGNEYGRTKAVIQGKAG